MKEMGISDKVFTDMLRIPSQKVRMVDRDYAKEHGLVGTDPGFEEWWRARKIRNEGEARVKAYDQLGDCYNSNVPHLECDSRYNAEMKAIK